jgi:hypothetical protein
MSARARLLLAVAAVGLLAAGCGGQGRAAGGGGGDRTLAITSPADGAEVTEPFTLTLRSSVKLGPPEQGVHHVHLVYDGDEAHPVMVFGDSAEVRGLPPGRHTIVASLVNADHSAVGVQAKVTVNVAGAGGSTATTSGGYGYP